LQLSNEKRIHVMKSLSTLSKYLGCHDRWKKIIESHQLKWSNAGGTEVFHNITGGEHSFESMSQWLKSVYAKLPKAYGNILVFNDLSGLRPKEACESIKILNGKGQEEYLNKNAMVLEHFRYPEIFIRRTKKAYISIVTDSILELVKQSSICGYNALRLAVKKRGLDMNMAYCRKIFATHLRMNGHDYSHRPTTYSFNI
jgi:hypothetical protein